MYDTDTAESLSNIILSNYCSKLRVPLDHECKCGMRKEMVQSSLSTCYISWHHLVTLTLWYFLKCLSDWTRLIYFEWILLVASSEGVQNFSICFIQSSPIATNVKALTSLGHRHVSTMVVICLLWILLYSPMCNAL